MNRLIAVIMTLFMVPKVVLAQEALEIKQILPAEKLVVTSGGSETFKVGDVLIATFQDGFQCSLPVVSQHSEYWVLSSDQCARRDDLRVKQILEKTVVPVSFLKPQPVLETPQAPALSMKGDEDVFAIQSVGRMVPQGAFELESTYRFGGGAIKHKLKSAPTNTLENDTRSSAVYLKGTYGLTSHLNIGAEIAYLLFREQEMSATIGGSSISATSTASGVYDPTFYLSYLVVKQEDERPFNFIIGASYTPQIIKAEDNNAGLGGDQTLFSANLSRFKGKFEYGVRFEYLKYSRSETKDTDSDDIMETSSRENLGIGIYSQIAITDFWYLNGGIGWVSYSDYQNKDKATGEMSSRYKAHSSTLLLLSTQFVLVPATSLISLQLSHASFRNLKGDIYLSSTPYEWEAPESQLTSASAKYIYRF